jgi:hypothetical protein
MIKQSIDIKSKTRKQDHEKVDSLVLELQHGCWFKCIARDVESMTYSLKLSCSNLQLAFPSTIFTAVTISGPAERHKESLSIPLVPRNPLVQIIIIYLSSFIFTTTNYSISYTFIYFQRIFIISPKDNHYTPKR